MILCKHNREIWQRREDLMGLVCVRCKRWRPATALLPASRGTPKAAAPAELPAAPLRGRGRFFWRGRSGDRTR